MTRAELRSELNAFVENSAYIPEKRSAMFKLFFQNGAEGRQLFKRVLALREATMKKG